MFRRMWINFVMPFVMVRIGLVIPLLVLNILKVYISNPKIFTALECVSGIIIVGGGVTGLYIAMKYLITEAKY